MRQFTSWNHKKLSLKSYQILKISWAVQLQFDVKNIQKSCVNCLQVAKQLHNNKWIWDLDSQIDRVWWSVVILCIIKFFKPETNPLPIILDSRTNLPRRFSKLVFRMWSMMFIYESPFGSKNVSIFAKILNF